MNIEEYKKRAEECVQLAQAAPASQRPLLLGLADTWLKLAEMTKAESGLMNGAKKGGGSSAL